MEAAQEGHLDLVRYLLESAADVHAQTQTGDTALTYACENGHTDVADLLLQFGADLVCISFFFVLFLLSWLTHSTVEHSLSSRSLSHFKSETLRLFSCCRSTNQKEVELH